MPDTHPKIIIDIRELRSLIPKHLDKLGVDIQFEVLPVADYILSDRCAVERKTVEDFYNSLFKEKKLFGQLIDLTQYERPILIIEGYEAEMFTARRIDARAVDGILNSIALMRIPIRYSVNPVGTARILSSIAQKEQFDERRPVSFHGKRSNLSPNEQREYIVSACSEIGPVLAKSLLTRFGSVMGVFDASQAELEQVDKIGPITAGKIREIVGGRYQG